MEAIARILLFHCADVHKQDVGKYASLPCLPLNHILIRRVLSRNTAIHWAAAKGNAEIVRMLLAFDASVNLCDRDNGFTPLHWAVVKEHVHLIDLLVANYANPNLPDKEGLTPLHLCARRGSAAMMEKLLQQRSIAVDHEDAYGVRPLHQAVRRGCRFLLKLANTDAIWFQKGRCPG